MEKGCSENRFSQFKKKAFLLVFFLAAAAGCFLRFYNLPKNVEFGWDQETTASQVLTMVRNKKPLLIGPRVGPAKFFLGPAYYYLAAPFLLASNFNPLGLYYCSVCLGILAGLILFFVSRDVFNERVAQIGIMIYSLSPLVVHFDRIPWNVNLLILASLLVFWANYKIFVQNSPDKKIYLVLGLGIGLGLQAHLTAVSFLLVLPPLFLLKRRDWRKAGLSLLVVFFSLLPLFVFDFRHQFFNLKGIIQFLASNSSPLPELSFVQRLINTGRISWELVGKLLVNYQGNYYHLKVVLGALVWFYGLLLLFRKKREFYLLFLFLLVSPLVLAFDCGSIPEYYFLLQAPFLIILTAYFFARWWKQFPCGLFVFLVIYLFFLGWQSFISVQTINDESLFYKQQAVEYILEEAGGRPFKLNPVAKKGRDVGFNYFFTRQGQLPVEKANLEFFLVYPFIPEMGNNYFNYYPQMPGESLTEYQEFGAYGVKKVEKEL